jgi:hypothetical protein
MRNEIVAWSLLASFLCAYATGIFFMVTDYEFGVGVFMAANMYGGVVLWAVAP